MYLSVLKCDMLFVTYIRIQFNKSAELLKVLLFATISMHT